MKKGRLGMVLAVCLLFSGCGNWMDGSHVAVTPHQEQSTNIQTIAVTASDYQELRMALEDMVESGAESGVIDVSGYDQSVLENGVKAAVNYVRSQLPLGVYAIETLSYEIGYGGGQPALSVKISYIHGRSEIRQIQEVRNMQAAQEEINSALASCSEGLVLLVNDYKDADLAQMVEDYARMNPDSVMETPQVAVGVYPEVGTVRIMEIKFTYQTSRDALRQMQSQTKRVFKSAVYYINSDGSEMQKYTQLYTFLMERFAYKQETSITPSYSLLCHGVGDSKAFAVVYGAMCRMAGLECQIVTGTRDGEPWFWNLICVDGNYGHVDLLRCDENDEFFPVADEQMEGYVWDYSAYPEAQE